MSNLSDSIKTAIDMERKGYDLYIKAAKKTLNKLGKETLEAIAIKELDHIAAIKKFNKDVLEEKNIDDAIAEIKPKDKKDYIKLIMEKLQGKLDNEVKTDSDLEKAYDIAMGLEKESYDLYKKLADEATLPNAKKFFEFLMGEENTHYELLQETLEYLNHPGDWFKEKERWVIEG